MEKIIVTILIGFAGGLLAKRLKLPAAFMIGALVAVAVYNLISDQAYLPGTVKTYTQIVTGTFIACGISKPELLGMKQIIKPIILSIGSMLLMVIVCGFLMHYIFKVELATAFLASIPGGIADVTLMSYDFNADVATVALFQTSRLCTMLILLPQLIKRIIGNKTMNTEIQATAIIDVEEPSFKEKVLRSALSLFVGACGGFIGTWLSFPAGALSFSMLATVVFNILSGKAYLPIQVRQLAQVFSGTLVGVGVTMTTLSQIPDLLIPVLFLLLVLILNNFFVSKLIARKTEMTMETAMFATAPAGAAEMVLIAGEMDLPVNKTQIVLMHIVRLISVVTIFPLVVKLILGVFN